MNGMTAAFAVAFLASIAGMGGLGIYGLCRIAKELMQDKAWGILAFIARLLICIVSNIALHFLGVLPINN